MTCRAETLRELVTYFRDDRETLSDIENALLAFEGYHQAIYQMEISRRFTASADADAEAYRETVQRLDKSRTIAHNAVLTQVKLINRIAAEANLPPFYDGTVSEERPFRREVADAVLAFVRQVIVER